ncbi:MAG: MFS transporter [Chlamydiia bacterium]|nr:MFS transporter [Chlamydiia bacterium]
MDCLYRSPLMPWLVWGLAAIFGLYTFLLQGVPSVMIPQLMQTYRIDVVQIGVLTSSFFYTYIIMQIPAGIMVDLWGPRRMIKINFLLCSIAIGWFAYSHTFWEGQVSRMLQGFFTSPAIICAFCLGSRWIKPALFTLVVALTEFLALSGGVIGEGGLAKSVALFGWRETMIAVAAVGLLLTFLSLFLIHDFPDHDQPLSNGQSLKEISIKTWKSLMRIISIPKLWVNGIYAGLVFGIFPAFAALWAVPYFHTRYKIPMDQSAFLASCYFLGACVGTLTLGWISVRMTKRRFLMIWGTLISFLLALFILYVPHISIHFMFVLMFFFGFFSSTYALSFALAGIYVDHSAKGVAMGFTNMLCIAFGAPIYQPLIGFLLQWTCTCEPLNKINLVTHNDYTAALTVLPLSLFLAFILAFFVKEPTDQPCRIPRNS